MGDTRDTMLIFEPEARVFQSKKLPQVIASIIASIGCFALGNVIGWSSSAIPNIIESQTFDISPDSEIVSWISSSPTLGALLSGFFVGFFLDKIGRKKTLLALSVPFVLGWLLIAFSGGNVISLLFGRFVTGFCGGGCLIAATVYISELAENKIRGTLGSTSVVILVSGILFSYICGFFDYIWLSLISAVIPFIFGICMIFLSETPRFLLLKGMKEDAARSLMKFRGVLIREHIEMELKEIEASIEGMNEKKSIKEILKPAVLKPFLISSGLMFFQQLAGINVIMFYTQDFFQTSESSSITPQIACIILGTCQVFFILISTALVDVVGRRILLIVSEAGMSIGLFSIGYYFYLKHGSLEEDKLTAENLSWLPLTSLVFYLFTYNLGIGPLPWTMLGELIPANVKGVASSLSTSFNWFLAFIVTKTFPNLKDLIGIHGCFWTFGVFCVLGVFFSFFIVPETKNKSLLEIQQMFEPKNNNNNNNNNTKK